MAKTKAADEAFSDDERAWIVTQFAMYLTAQQVADAFEEQYGRTVQRNQVQRYNADCPGSSRKLADKWKRMHAEARKLFMDDLTGIPIAHRAMRLKQLQAHYMKSIQAGNTGQALSILKQAAEEAGGLLTNERKVKVDHSGKIGVEEMSTDEMRNLIADRLAEVFEKSGTAVTQH